MADGETVSELELESGGERPDNELCKHKSDDDNTDGGENNNMDGEIVNKEIF